MVARHTRRTGWHATSGCVCIDCGTRYLFTHTYKGNYCLDCHETWIARQRGESSAARTPTRLAPARLPLATDEDDADDLDESYETT